MEGKALLAHPVGFSFFGKEYYPLMRTDGHVFLRTNSATVEAVSVCREVKCGGPGHILGTLSLGLRTPIVPGLRGDKVAPAAQPEKALLLLCRSHVALGPCACQSLIQGLTELRKPIYSLEYWFILKDITDQQGDKMCRAGS